MSLADPIVNKLEIEKFICAAAEAALIKSAEDSGKRKELTRLFPACSKRMSGSSHRNWTSLSCGVLLCFASGAALAQQPRSPQLPAPPPMRFVSRAEREQLNAARDPKARVRTTIDLAGDHLTHAEYYTSEKKFVQASEELGGYLGLIDNATVCHRRSGSRQG